MRSEKNDHHQRSDAALRARRLGGRARSTAAPYLRARAPTGRHAPATPTTGERCSLHAPRRSRPGGILFTASGEVLALTRLRVPAGEPGRPRLRRRLGRALHAAPRHRRQDHALREPRHDRRATVADRPPVAEVDGPWAVDLHTATRPLARQGRARRAGRADRGARRTRTRTGKHVRHHGTRYAFGFDIVAATPQRARTSTSIAAGAWPTTSEMARERLHRPLRRHRDVQGHELHAGAPRDLLGVRKLARRWPSRELPALLQVADDLRQLPEPRQRSGEGARRRGAPARHRLQERHSRSIAPGHGPHRSPVLGQRASTTRRRTSISSRRASPVRRGRRARRPPTLERHEGRRLHGVSPTRSATRCRGATARRRLPTPPAVHGRDGASTRRASPRDRAATPRPALRDYYDFTTYNQSTQGHLNSDGLCFVRATTRRLN